MTVEPSKKAANYFTEQLNVLRNRMEAAQIKLSQYQHDKGIVDVDLRLDVETRRLNDLSSQLVAAQTELMGVTSEYDSYVSQNTRNMASRDPIINNLKMNVAQAESRFSEFSQKVGKNHPSYISTQAELDQLRIELDRSIRNATKAIVNREAEIRSALEQQRTKVLTLNQARSELMLLVREVEGAQQAYNGAMQRLNQTSLEGQSTLSGVSILDTAKVPDKPHSPILWLNLILSIILGVLLGLGLGLLAEMIDRRVRSADDLFDVLQVPVLGVVKQGTGNHQQEKRVQFTWPHLLRSN